MPAEGVVPQLLALCRWRHYTKRHDPLAVLLWFEGWPIPTDRVRQALRAWAPKTVPEVSTVAEREEMQERLDRMALQFAPLLKSRFGRRGVTSEEIADAILPVLQRIAGRKARVRHRDAAVIERLTGLDGVRRTGLARSGSPLTARPAEAFVTFSDLRMTSAAQLIEAITETAMESARPRLRLFLSVLPPKEAVVALFLAVWFGYVGLGGTVDEFLTRVPVSPP